MHLRSDVAGRASLETKLSLIGTPSRSQLIPASICEVPAIPTIPFGDPLMSRSTIVVYGVAVGCSDVPGLARFDSRTVPPAVR